MSWSPVNSVSETQPTWGQQATKQDMQNSGERIAWQQHTTMDTSKPNGFPENQDNPESHIYAQSNRVNLNSRLKSMILNKQQQQQMQQQQQQQQTHQHHQMQSQHVNINNGSASEYPTDDQIRDAHENTEKMQEKHTDFINQSNIISMTQSNENLTGNFLSHSHHPRVDSLPDGGGLWEWTEGEHNHNNDIINKKWNDSFRKFYEVHRRK